MNNERYKKVRYSVLYLNIEDFEECDSDNCRFLIMEDL